MVLIEMSLYCIKVVVPHYIYCLFTVPTVQDFRVTLQATSTLILKIMTTNYCLSFLEF